MTKLGSPLGISAIVEDLDEGVIVADLVRIRAERINTKYLCYHLNSQRTNDFINSMQKGTTRPRVTLSVVRELPISVPSPEEQQRIVAILDEAFDGIATAKANAEKNLQNAHALFESHLQSVFTQRSEGWEEKCLREACEFSQGIQVDVKSQSEQRVDKNQVRFLRIIDFTQGNEPERYITNPGKKFLVCQSDVSLVRYGASTGFVCTGLAGAIANNLFRVIPKESNLSNEFLYWFLRSALFQDEIRKAMNGAAMPAISFGMINEILFPFPSLPEEQQQIVGKLNIFAEETQRLESLYQQKLAALEELKKSLLHQAFSGQL
jgi:type I restriction enzyme S subunit